jgi:hypothetical protein
MDGFVIDRADGRADGEDWTENYEELPGDASISIILESTTKAGVGPRLHQHPYAETFIIRAVGLHSPSDRRIYEGMPGRSLWCPPTHRTSFRPGQTVMRPYTFTPTPAS